MHVFCDLSQDSSSGQVMSKVYMSCVQSERTRRQCSLQGRRTCVCCEHSGTKAWHRNKCTSGEQCRLTSGMKCCKCKKQRLNYVLGVKETILILIMVVFLIIPNPFINLPDLL